MDVSGVLKTISERQKKASALTDVERNLVLDVGCLTAWDAEPVAVPKAGPKREDYFRNLARDDAQIVLNQLYSMQDTEIVDGETVLKIPEPTTTLPRAKPVPKPKEPTKWERFAREKGIKSKSSKHREKKVWDDTTQRWVARYGYDRVKNEREKNWCVEVKND